MTIINLEEFKKKYLMISKKYIISTLINYVGDIKNIYPFISYNDKYNLNNYISNSIIYYSNNFVVKINKNMIDDYIDNNFNDNRVYMDVIRLNFTKKFISKCNGKVKSNINPIRIDTTNINFMKQDEIEYYTFDDISKKSKFVNCINESNKYFKYLLHQDIHNSIINPILTTIMISHLYKSNKNDDNESYIVQLQNIKQLYCDINNEKTRIKMMYIIDKYMIINNSNLNSEPIFENIYPELIIQIEFSINKNDIDIDILY